MTPPPHTLAELMARYLETRTAAAATAPPPAHLDDGPEVVPYDASFAQPVEPALAWREAARALDLHGLGEGRPGGDALRASPEWALLVLAVPSHATVPLAAGNFPQLVRHLPSFSGDGLAVPPPSWSEGRAWRGDLTAWADAAAPHALADRLFAAGVLRLAGLHDEAARLLAAAPRSRAAAGRDAVANEQAALHWHAGRADEADRLWRSLPPNPAVLFNRGLAALTLGRADEAAAPLRQALPALPEDGGWHHLACLYLAAAEARPAAAFRS